MGAVKKQRTQKRDVGQRAALPAARMDGGARFNLPRLLLLAAILAAGTWAYSNSFDGVLVLDDIRAIARNTTIRSFASALVPPGESTVAGRPVANLSLALNYALAPADVRDAFVPEPPGAPQNGEAVWRNLWGYHLLNLLVHLAAALVLFGVARRTLRSPRLRAWTDASSNSSEAGVPAGRLANSDWLAFAVTLLWVVHPLQTESVSYLVQRVESLMALFYLLTLYCAVRAAEGPGRAWWTAGSIAACALGMGTKEVTVTAPLLVWVWDRLFLPAARDARATARELAGRDARASAGLLAGRDARASSRLVLYAGLAATWIILIVLVANEHRAPSIELGQGMVWRYLATQAAVVVHYVRLAIVPAPLVFLYTWPIASSFAAVAPQALLLALVAGATLAGIVRRSPLAFTGAWFLLILAPTSSILPIVTEVAAEHRMYLPLAAVIGCLVLGVAASGRLVRRVASRSVLLGAGAVACAGVALALSAATRARNLDYRSDETLWRRTVEEQPDNQRARVAYGVTLFGQRRFAEAEAQLRAALALEPNDAVATGRLGGVVAAQGRIDEAIGLFERAARLTGRRDAQVLMMLAAAQAEARRFGDAAATAGEALDVARAQGRAGLADELARRLAFYRRMADM